MPTGREPTLEGKWCGGGRHRLGESALDSGRERVEERNSDLERAQLLGWEWFGGGRHRLGESALESESGVGERDTDWERAHLRVEGNGVGEEDTDWERAHLRVEGNGGERHRLGESALDRVGMVFEWETPIWGERTL